MTETETRPNVIRNYMEQQGYKGRKEGGREGEREREKSSIILIRMVRLSSPFCYRAILAHRRDILIGTSVFWLNRCYNGNLRVSCAIWSHVSVSGEIICNLVPAIAVVRERTRRKSISAQLIDHREIERWEGKGRKRWRCKKLEWRKWFSRTNS